MDKMQNAVQLSQNALRECRMQDPARVFYALYGVNQTHTVTRLSLNRHFGFCILHYMQNAHPFPLRDTTLHSAFWILDFGFSTLGPTCDTTLHSAFCILYFGFWISNFRNGPPVRSNEASASRGRELADADSGEFDCRTWGVEWN